MMEKLRAARFWAEYAKTFISVKTFPPTFEKLEDAEGKAETTGKDGSGAEEAKERENEIKEGSKGAGSDVKGDSGVAEVQTEAGKEGEVKEDKSGEAGTDGKEEVGQMTEDQKVEMKDGEKEEPKDGSEKTFKSATVVFSYHQTDIKFVYFLKELITAYAPHLVLKSEFKTDQARLDSLEAADSIIALLSPNYIESPQHVEEFHMGLWRQRVSPEEAPLLVPVQVALLPKRPTYFQLMGYPVNSWDAMWADLLGVQNIRSPAEIDNFRHSIVKRKLPAISPDELHPMIEVAQVVISSIKARRSVDMKDGSSSKAHGVSNV